MNILFKIVAAVAVVTMAYGCCNCRSRSKEIKPLVGTEWQLVVLKGRNVQPEEDKYTVIFGDNDRMSGVGECNRLMASYEAGEKGELQIGQVASTRMACPNMEMETEFAKVLSAATHYRMDGPMMMLLSNGEMTAVFQAKEK